MKELMCKVVLGSVLLLFPVMAGAEPVQNEMPEKPLLRAAIFVQNRAGHQLQNQIDVLNDHLTTRLTEKGFSVIDKDVVIAKFRDSQENDDSLRTNLKGLEEVIKLHKSESSVEDAITGASALRIAQMIGADYLLLATINSFEEETRTFIGENTIYGTNNQVKIFNLRIALKLLEGNQGGTVYGDIVTASDRIVVGQNLVISSTGMLPKLIDAGAQKIADNIAGKVESIRNISIKAIPVVEFTVNSNIEGAIVELDGAAVGATPGRFTAAPGLHHLRVSKEWLTTWERTVNVFQNQTLNVSLELSEEGLRRYATIEQLKLALMNSRQQQEMEIKERDAGIVIAKEQSEAEAYSKKKIAEGEKKKREESFERIEGPPTVNVYH